MKVDVYHRPGRTHDDHTTLMTAGLERHGLDVARFGDAPRAGVDVAVVWSWRVGERIRQQGYAGPILVMERGYLGDRFYWTSLGWDGLNGRARFPSAQDSGERFWSNFGHFACEWERFEGYTLVIGQVEGDMALRGVHFGSWVTTTIYELLQQGRDVRFRPHPEADRRGQMAPAPPGLISRGLLQDAFAEAGCVVTWNSNTGVESVLAGIPTVACDEGAMAWPVTSHSIADEIVTPDRSEWFRDMAWRQWSPDELADGSAWEVVRGAM